MAVNQTQPLKCSVQDDSRSCFHECMWYECNEEDGGACLNRLSFICAKHRADVFGQDE